MTDVNVFAPVGHVDPPPDIDDDHPGLVYYLGPRLYAAGLYLPGGYDLESRPGDTEGWTVFRARDTGSGQLLSMWAVNGSSTDVDLMETNKEGGPEE